MVTIGLVQCCSQKQNERAWYILTYYTYKYIHISKHQCLGRKGKHSQVGQGGTGPSKSLRRPSQGNCTSLTGESGYQAHIVI